MSINITDNIVIFGLGSTGFHTAKFLFEHQYKVKVIDEDHNPRYYERLKKELPGIEFSSCPDMGSIWILAADIVVVSPGVPVEKKIWSKLTQAKIISDIELFSQFAAAPIIAVTGTNGKSTVVSLITHVLKCSGYNVAVGGNLGDPALSLIDDKIDCYVLELSSFQLAYTYSLRAEVAVILNITPDHLDWHGDYAKYTAAKLNILVGAKAAVLPYDIFDRNERAAVKTYTFSSKSSLSSDFNIKNINEEYYLTKGNVTQVGVSDFALQGEHNILNYLAAYSVLDVLGLETSLYSKHAKSFLGLPHRCQNIGFMADRFWYNDSKATNSDAMIAALSSINKLHSNVVLIAGGVFKEDMAVDLPQHIQLKAIVLFGRDDRILYDAWQHSYDCVLVQDLAAAIDVAYRHSDAGDAILFSPSCASYDQFENYEKRGEFFVSYTQKKYNK